MMHVDPKIVKGLAGCASTNPTRYAVNGILCEDHGGGKGRMVATDGKILARVDFKHFDPAEFPSLEAVKSAPNTASTALVPGKELAKACAKANISKRGIPVLTKPVMILGEETSTVIGTDLSSTSSDAVRNIEGRFPNYMDVVPDASDATGEASFNPELLIKLCEAAIAVNPRSPAIKLTLHGKLRAATILARNPNDGTELHGLIMPLSID